MEPFGPADEPAAVRRDDPVGPGELVETERVRWWCVRSPRNAACESDAVVQHDRLSGNGAALELAVDQHAVTRVNRVRRRIDGEAMVVLRCSTGDAWRHSDRECGHQRREQRQSVGAWALLPSYSLVVPPPDSGSLPAWAADAPTNRGEKRKVALRLSRKPTRAGSRQVAPVQTGLARGGRLPGGGPVRARASGWAGGVDPVDLAARQVLPRQRAGAARPALGAGDHRDPRGARRRGPRADACRRTTSAAASAASGRSPSTTSSSR